MGQEINLLNSQPKTARDYDKRAREKTEEDCRIAKQFGREFFDGPRSQGYGGYHYDGRWKAVALRMINYYHLPEDAAILDVGCAKGFLLHDFKELLPHCMVAGVDVSSYAIENAIHLVKPYLRLASAERLPFADKSFDLVVSINSIHNLPLERCKQAIQEIQRLSRGNSYITVDAWRNEQQHQNLLKWIMTAETYVHVDNWKELFAEAGYSGDYYWFIAE